MTVGQEFELYQLVYVSSANVPFSDKDLDALLHRARSSNHALDVSGILLFADQTFFQVLEGERATVQILFERIEHDPRHSDATIIAERPIEHRSFADWSMGFVRDKTLISSLPGFVDFFKTGRSDFGFAGLRGDDKRISHILESFRRGRWRRSHEMLLS
ncbi:BLUF domain-containing protein [Roseiconus lacunae]|uniref:BLUF domain-containing protein n=1 Tax=Roseiconus lacunae TaxID=2605694 RepID=A0ABT7PQ86_9BACT|nr:BLUF domain-containing protein [Roseiconus lacunae]MCD0460189.1 BLUF domain-containing protein [Roseiconus lacunae]MDM4018301.1 BLUF domain-containing protein [Roseiconus lacunae]WRQ53625.1 BLUF domain-containing protein [Stieleria sp. HD01]